MHLPNYNDARKRDNKDYKRVDFKFDEEIKNKYKGKTFFLKTYGCQMNEHDSENIEALLIELGFSKVGDYTEADLVLLNTCSIRENAHNKAFGMLGRLKHLKATKKDLLIGLCGCMAQEASVVEEIMGKYKYVNFVFGTHNLYELPEIIDKAIEENKQQIEVYSREGDLVEGLPVVRANSYKAYVNIIYGCNKFCTYCIVPYTRGRERSRRKEDILSEIDELKGILNDSFAILLQNEINEESLALLKIYENKVDELTDQYRQRQIERLSLGQVDAEDCVRYSQIMTDIERISDHLMNMIEECIKNNFTLINE